MPKQTKGQHRWATCKRKIRYSSYALAWLARKEHPPEKQNALDIYGPCRYCREFHLGGKLVEHMNMVKVFGIVLPREIKKALAAQKEGEAPASG